MKKILFALSLILVIFAGCKKSSNDGGDTIPAKLLGKWKEGAGTSIYYSAGKEVYREQIPAVTSREYWEFKANNVLTINVDLGAANLFPSDITYALRDDNKTLRLSDQSQMQDYQISFADDNTINITGKSTTAITYNDINGVTHSAESQTIIGQLIRI